VGEEFLDKRLNERRTQDAFRQLRITGDLIDFCSNDYLGIVKSNLLNEMVSPINHVLRSGSTGSRLLSGNYRMIEETEEKIARFHDAASGLIFNSGYDANLGLLSSVPQKGDTIIYDYLSHASLRDGIRLSFAKAYSFRHNDLNDLEEKLKIASGNIFVVTESVFSMDGDLAPLRELSTLIEQYHANLVVDEAHATGVVGSKGEGLVQQLGLQQKCFARVHTFGKALGSHGAIILGSPSLREYLINFCRPFIYTTSLPETAVSSIASSYDRFPSMDKERTALHELIRFFQDAHLDYKKLRSETPIQGVIIPGNKEVKKIAQRLQEKNLDVRAILYPSVPKGEERLRIVLHAFNRIEDLSALTGSL
jgi:8-amino-7-oxononanoate synthase